MKEPMKHFLRYQTHYLVFFIVSFFLLNGTVLALAVVMEAQRNHSELHHPKESRQLFNISYSTLKIPLMKLS